MVLNEIKLNEEFTLVTFEKLFILYRVISI